MIVKVPHLTKEEREKYIPTPFEIQIPPLSMTQEINTRTSQVLEEGKVLGTSTK